MVMGCGPGDTVAREEGLSTPRQLWLIRQQQSQQQIQRVVEAVLIRLTLVRAEPTEPWDLGGAGHVRPTSGQHHAARRRVLRTRRDPLDMGLRPPVLLPAGSVAAAAAVFPSRPGGCQLLRHDRGLFVLTVTIQVM